MNIGYACLTVGVPGTKQRTCTMKNATPVKLLSLIQSNIEALNRILDYNIQNDIKLFRISSDIIPFGSHSINKLKWWEIFNDQLNEIGLKAVANGIRLSIGEKEGIPVVFDNLHHQVNPDNTRSEIEWIASCRKTWKTEDGRQKLHYSQQNPHKRPGSHSATLDIEDFVRFSKCLAKQDIDIMVEVKDKNLSAIKCTNAIALPKIRRLEKEWERYKYLVLEHSPKLYKEIRKLLKDKRAYPVVEFYRLIDEALQAPIKPGNAVNVAQYVWGYFKDTVDIGTRLSFEKKVNKASMGESTGSMKRLLWRLTVEQQQRYLLDSLYFMKVM